ncbi:MAG: phage integrase N-terminal SAM-like domain-containing protein [Acidobacteriota bacterium]
MAVILTRQDELLQQFQNHLRSRRLVPENQAPYYVKWVQSFQQFCTPGSKADAAKIESFIHFLENGQTLAHWQIRQAHQAVTPFLQFSESRLESAEISDEVSRC